MCLLGAEEGADGGDGEGFLEAFDTNIHEVGGEPGELMVDIIHQNLHESEGQNALECFSYAPRVGAVDSDGENLRLFFPGNLVCEPRQSTCTYRFPWNQIQQDDIAQSLRGFGWNKVYLSHGLRWRRCSLRGRTSGRWSGRGRVPRRQWRRFLSWRRRRRSCPCFAFFVDNPLAPPSSFAVKNAVWWWIWAERRVERRWWARSRRGWWVTVPVCPPSFKYYCPLVSQIF